MLHSRHFCASLTAVNGFLYFLGTQLFIIRSDSDVSASSLTMTITYKSISHYFVEGPSVGSGSGFVHSSPFVAMAWIVTIATKRLNWTETMTER